MTEIIQWLAVFVTLLGVISSGTIAYLVYRSTIQAQRAEILREVSSRYDQLMDFRAKHPQVLALSRNWSEACFEAIYRQETPEERDWALYYTYAELCSGFCSSVLSARKIGMLAQPVYEKYYRPLVRLLLTEHYPYLKTVLHGKYLSRYISEFVAETRKSGWDWDLNHQRLAGGKMNNRGKSPVDEVTPPRRQNAAQ